MLKNSKILKKSFLPKKIFQTNYKLYFFMLFFSVILMFVDGTKPIFWLKNGINFIFFPFQERLSALLNSNKYKIENIHSILNAYQNNFALEKQVQNYKILKSKLSVLERENIELKKIVNLNVKNGNNQIECRVIGRTIDDWFSVIIINKGEKDGIKKKNVVITHENGSQILVGQIIETYKHYSKVLLVTNVSSNIIAFAPARNLYGIIAGDNSTLLKMSPIQTYFKNDFRTGDIIITSGLGGIFPYGIYIGQIKSINFDKNANIESVNVEPYEKINSLNFVSVIVDKKLLESQV